jgi:methylthioribose-1-phosphate isomerase
LRIAIGEAKRSEAIIMTAQARIPRTLEWIGGVEGVLRLLDQTRLPLEEVTIDCHTPQDVWEAIRSLRVRGAPAIGVAAAYGVVLGLRNSSKDAVPEVSLQDQVKGVCDYLATSRPTAVNLFWALDRMRRTAAAACAEGTGAKGLTSQALAERLLAEARAIEDEDRAMCAAIGRLGAALMPTAGGVLTHCNAGGLATAGEGTALAVLFAAHAAGKQIEVFADETRPLLQGARLTAWELCRRGLPTTLLCDSMAGQVMKEGRIQAVVVGADRIAANGDAANKIGTYSVAVLAKAHGIPFYVAAPSSTFDLSLDCGEAIPIEQRSPEEITQGFGRQTAPQGIAVYNPAFDVTPAALITAIVTERGIIEPVTETNVRRVLSAAETPLGPPESASLPASR